MRSTIDAHREERCHNLKITILQKRINIKIEKANKTIDRIEKPLKKQVMTKTVTQKFFFTRSASNEQTCYFGTSIRV